MLKKILIALAAVLGVGLVGLVVAICLQPSTYSIQRSATIAASPGAVFVRVNDLKEWDTWSPWKELDPNPKTTLSNPSAGQGATFAWSGNDQVGEGRMTILESRPDQQVDIEQEFVRPFAGKSRHAFTFASEGDGTRVTWKMDGTNDFLGKAMCLFMNMDSMVGGQIEKGLANIKAVVEKDAASPAVAAP